MDEIITDAELHQADGWIDQQRSTSRQAQLVHWALLELKLWREQQRAGRTTKSRLPRSSRAALVARSAIS